MAIPYLIIQPLFAKKTLYENFSIFRKLFSSRQSACLGQTYPLQCCQTAFIFAIPLLHMRIILLLHERTVIGRQHIPR